MVPAITKVETSAGEPRLSTTLRESSPAVADRDQSVQPLFEQRRFLDPSQPVRRRFGQLAGTRMGSDVALVPGDQIAPGGTLHARDFGQVAVGLGEDILRLLHFLDRGDQLLSRVEGEHADHDDDQESQTKRQLLPGQGRLTGRQDRPLKHDAFRKEAGSAPTAARFGRTASA